MELKIEIMRYLEANIYTVKAKVIALVVATIIMTSLLVTKMFLLFNTDYEMTLLSQI